MKKSVVIDNTRQRYDTAGNPVDAHEGCLEFFEGRYWMYATAYGATTGYRTSNRCRIYSSPDLDQEGWTCHGEALDHTPHGLHSRPCAKHCPATGKYVLWYDYFTDYIGERNPGDGPVKPVIHRVAVADNPAGPFKTVTMRARTGTDFEGDLGLFVDTDGAGYVIYTSMGKRFSVAIERLRDDFLDTTGESSGTIAETVEAPAMFRRGAYYYALMDRLCCYGPQGTGARVYRATHPLGPWEYRNNINRNGASKVLTGPEDAVGQIIIPAQQAHVARLPTAGPDVWMWMGDRWQTGGAKNRGADLQYWSEPLRFTAGGDIELLRFVDKWTLEHRPTGPS